MEFLRRLFRHRTLLAGAVVLVLAGSAVGIAAAQPAPTPPTPGAAGQARPGHQAFIDALAKRLGISSATLQTAIDGARTDLGLPAGGKGFAGSGRGHDRGGPGFGGAAAAAAIGITPEQLRTELNGKSLAQVAQAHGKNPAEVATALKDAANKRIDQEVTAGHLTADQANQRKQQLDQRIDQMINQVKPQRTPPAAPSGNGAEGQGA
jgi:hypothetical protein